MFHESPRNPIEISINSHGLSISRGPHGAPNGGPQVCATQLHDLVELVRGELSKLARRTLTAPRRWSMGKGDKTS